MSDALRIAPIGAELSKPFDISQGRPALRAAVCISRRVRSIPAA
jgi:hypothetical protein